MAQTVRTVDDAGMLLALWERGLTARPEARGDALLRVAPETPPALTLGEWNARLLALRASLFGAGVELLSSCPACGTAAQFRGDCQALASQAFSGEPVSTHRIDADGYGIEFRLPTSGDVAAAAMAGPAAAFPRHLLDRCVLASTHGAEHVPVRDLPEAVVEALSIRMEQLDPGASLTFSLECPECGGHWDAPLDVAQLVWQEVQQSAERLFLEIDALARAYGWTEHEVLSLSPVRRAAYLQMAVA